MTTLKNSYWRRQVDFGLPKKKKLRARTAEKTLSEDQNEYKTPQIVIIIYSAFRMYSDPLTLKPCSKRHYIVFPPSSILTQYPIMTKQKQVFIHFCKCIKKYKYHIYISIQTLYSVLWRTFGITPASLLGYDAISLAHLYLGSFSHSSLQILKLCQIGWGASLHSYS
jgi:hypothetical protein